MLSVKDYFYFYLIYKASSYFLNPTTDPILGHWIMRVESNKVVIQSTVLRKAQCLFYSVWSHGEQSPRRGKIRQTHHAGQKSEQGCDLDHDS